MNAEIATQTPRKEWDPLGEIDEFRTLRDALFDGLVAVERGERMRVLDCDESARVLQAALHPRREQTR